MGKKWICFKRLWYVCILNYSASWKLVRHEDANYKIRKNFYKCYNVHHRMFTTNENMWCGINPLDEYQFGEK